MRASPAWIVAGALVALVLAAVLLRMSWVGDDAYITLRTVENIAQGHGAVWNLGERVQTYTHPLWMMLLVGSRLLTGECYFGTIGLSFALALAAIAMLLRLGGGWPAAVAVGSLLLWSRSFPEYAVCGLENPLTFALLGLLATVAARPAAAGRRTLAVALLCGLMATTRMDLLLVGAPLLLAGLPAIGWRGWLWRAALGLSPLWLWLGFATVYYGTPLPITAYAKAISHGVPALAMAEQGLQHYVFMLLYDPLTLAVILAGIGVGLRLRPGNGAGALAIGAALYLAYIVKVGGDFMAGRFFTVPFVVAVAILSPVLGRARWRWSLGVALAAPVSALVVGLPPWSWSPAAEREPTWHHHGILDERSAYWRQLGLFAPDRQIPQPGAGTATLRALGWTRPIVTSAGKAGVYAFEGGELMHFFDPLLCDPLLARLPLGSAGEWRIGHIPRDVPAGYLESLAFGGNRIRDPALHRFYGALRAMISAPVSDGARWSAMWGLWTGAFDADLAAFVGGAYRRPPRVAAGAATLASPLPGQLPGIGPLWFGDERARLVPRGGLAVTFTDPVTATGFAVQVTGEFRYRFRCRYRDAVVGAAELDVRPVSQVVGMVERRVELAALATFDRVEVDVVDPNPHAVAALGSLRPR